MTALYDVVEHNLYAQFLFFLAVRLELLLMTTSLASHTLHTEEGSGHAANIELLPQQKLNYRLALFVARICYPHCVQAIY